MDEDFLMKLKSISVKDVLTDQRPATSRLRLGSSRARIPFIGKVDESETNKNKRIEETSDASNQIQTIAELLSKPVANQLSEDTIPVTSLKSGKARKDEMENSGFTRTRLVTATGKRPLTSFQRDSTAEYIPDLNDIQAEEVIQTIATAPEIEAERITSLRELDADLARLSTFSVVRGVDMRKLARFMLPEKKLVLYTDEDEDMRHITYEQLYNDLLPLINGKNLINFDFAALKNQTAGDGFSFFLDGNMTGGFDKKFSGVSKKDGKKKSLDTHLSQKLKDYATASMQKLSKKQKAPKYGTNFASLQDILTKAREKHEKKENKIVETKTKVG